MSAMRRALIVSLIVIGLVAACGDDGDPAGGASSSGGAPSAGPIPQAQLLDQYTAAYCDTLGPCCTKYSVPFDKAACTTLVRNAFQQPFADAAVRGWTYDADAAGKCVAAIRAVITACDASAANPADIANAGDDRGSVCRHIYTGSKKVGEPCDSTSDCAQPDGTSVTCAASLCREYRQGGDGAECQSSYDEEKPGPYLDCVSPLDCEESSGRSTCTTPKPRTLGTAREGAACKSDADCATDRCFQSKCFTDKMGISPGSCANPLK